MYDWKSGIAELQHDVSEIVEKAKSYKSKNLKFYNSNQQRQKSYRDKGKSVPWKPS